MQMPQPRGASGSRDAISGSLSPDIYSMPFTQI